MKKKALPCNAICGYLCLYKEKKVADERRKADHLKHVVCGLQKVCMLLLLLLLLPPPKKLHD